MGNQGKKVKVHYTGTLDDGTKFDSSYDRNEPLEFECMAGQMIPGFDAAVRDMEVGQTVNVHLEPKDAYGERDDANVRTFPLEALPGAEDCKVGQTVYLAGPGGQPFPVRVADKDQTSITLDANHELAGKALNFEITLIEVED